MTDAPETLWITDAELAERMGVSRKTLRRAVQQLPGFPPRDTLFNRKRYWPAVRAFLDKRQGAIVEAPKPEEEVFTWNGQPLSMHQG